MRILDTQNLQLSHNNFDISINDLNLENDVCYIETSTNLYFDFSYNSYSREKSAFLGITIPGIKMGSLRHYLSWNSYFRDNFATL